MFPIEVFRFESNSVSNLNTYVALAFNVYENVDAELINNADNLLNPWEQVGVYFFFHKAAILSFLELLE